MESCVAVGGHLAQCPTSAALSGMLFRSERPFLPPFCPDSSPDQLTLRGEHDALLLGPDLLVHSGADRWFHPDTELSHPSRDWEVKVFMFYLVMGLKRKQSEQ